MAKKSRAQKVQEEQEQAAAGSATPRMSKYALKKQAQLNGTYIDRTIPDSSESASEAQSSDTDSAAGAGASGSNSSGSAKAASTGSGARKSASGKSSSSSGRKGSTSKSSGSRTSSRSSSASGRAGRAASHADAKEREILRLNRARSRAVQAAIEGASGIEDSQELERTYSRTITIRRKGRTIQVVRHTPESQMPVKIVQQRIKREKHAEAVREARAEALARLEAEGRSYTPPDRKSNKIPDKIEFNRKSVYTCGIEVKDRVPDLTDYDERVAATMPHNRRDQFLFAPIKRVNSPVKGTDIVARFLDSWQRRMDPEGLLTGFFDRVKYIRSHENGISCVGLPAFLKFLEGIPKRHIVNSYSLDFKLFIKRREITDFISSMKGPALEWMQKRHPLESSYAFVYLDTFPAGVKLGKKKVISTQTLYILGVTLDGRKDLLGVVPDMTSRTVSLGYWERILGHLKELGCNDICYIVASFKCRYLERAAAAIYPGATLHFNLMEVLQFDSYSLPEDMRAAFMSEAADLCDAPDFNTARTMLEQMRQRWEQHMSDGQTVLQGNVEALRIHTLLPLEERRIFTTNKMIATAAALIMGPKVNDFFSDNEEMLIYIFYRYLLIAKREWIERQDHAVNNLSFSRIFSALRHAQEKGSKLLDRLLTRQHQEFMRRHFGVFGSGPVFNLNPNRKRISLAGQIEANTNLLSDRWSEHDNAGLNTAPRAPEQLNQSDDSSDSAENSEALSSATQAPAAAAAPATSTSSAASADATGPASNAADRKGGRKAENSGSSRRKHTGSASVSGGTELKDSNSPELTLNDSLTLSSAGLINGAPGPEPAAAPVWANALSGSMGASAQALSSQADSFNLDAIRTFENRGFATFGTSDMPSGSPVLSGDAQSSLTLAEAAADSFISISAFNSYQLGTGFFHDSLFSTGAQLNYTGTESLAGAQGSTQADPADAGRADASHADTSTGSDSTAGGADAAGADAADSSDNGHESHKAAVPTRLALALALESPFFRQSRIFVNGLEYVQTRAALGDQGAARLLQRLSDARSDINGMDSIDRTFGFRSLSPEEALHGIAPESKNSQGKHSRRQRHHNHGHASEASSATSSAAPAAAGNAAVGNAAASSAAASNAAAPSVSVRDDRSMAAVLGNAPSISLNLPGLPASPLAAESALSGTASAVLSSTGVGSPAEQDACKKADKAAAPSGVQAADSITAQTTDGSGAQGDASKQADKSGAPSIAQAADGSSAHGKDKKHRHHGAASATEESVSDASYGRRIKYDDQSLKKYGLGYSSLSQRRYAVDSVAGLEGFDQIDPAAELKAMPAQSFTEGLSSNIGRANTVMGMIRPSITQALLKDRQHMKEMERQNIFDCLGKDFDFTCLDNVIHQVTPVFKQTLQNAIKWSEAQTAEKKRTERERRKKRAHERYLKRQALKAQAAGSTGTAPAAQGEAGTPAAGVPAAGAIAGLSSQRITGPLSGGSAPVLSADGSAGTSGMDNSLIEAVARDNEAALADSAQLGQGIISASDDASLELTRPSEVKVTVVAPEFRSEIAQRMAKMPGVHTQKPDTNITIKNKD